MTRYEAEATHGYSAERDKRSDWSQLLVPIVAAVLVIALGMALIGLTSEPETPLASPPAAAGSF